MPKPTTDDIIANYSDVFKKIAEFEINTNIEAKITGFQVFLKRIKEQLDKYK